MTTAPTVDFRADPYCLAPSRFLLSFWSQSRPPRNWASSAQCWEGFASDFIGAITAADIAIILVRGPIMRVIADGGASQVIAAMAAGAVVAAEAEAAGELATSTEIRANSAT
jgi:hypothetical protein